MALSTNYTNPLGALVPDDHKRRLVELATRHKVPLIEDDAYGDTGFDGRRPASLKAWDVHGWVLSCGTLSKTLSPGLRVGWVAPGRFYSRVMHLKLVTSIGSTTLSQLAAAEFLQNGGYDRHLRKLRRSYRDHVRTISDAVRQSFPAGTRLSRPCGGQFLWVELPQPADTIAMFEQAWDAGVSFAPGPMFSPSGGYRSFLRLNCSVHGGDDVLEAVRMLGRLAAAQLV